MTPGHLTPHRSSWGEGGGEQSLGTPRVWGGGLLAKGDMGGGCSLSASTCCGQHRQMGPAGEQGTSHPPAAPTPGSGDRNACFPGLPTRPCEPWAHKPSLTQLQGTFQIGLGAARKLREGNGPPAGQGLPGAGAGQAGGTDSLSSGQAPSPRGRKCIQTTEPSWRLERTGHLGCPTQR